MNREECRLQIVRASTWARTFVMAHQAKSPNEAREGVNSVPECLANHKILPLRRDVISIRKSPRREFLMVAFRTITNSVATVLRDIPLTYVLYVSIYYFFVSLVGILRWPTTVTVKENKLNVIILRSGVHQTSLVCL